MQIPFVKPSLDPRAFEYVKDAMAQGELSADGKYTDLCHFWLNLKMGGAGSLITPSGTHALEMAAYIARIKPGDEVILPSYTVSSVGNAFAARGASLVFVDIRRDCLNLDENQVLAAITPKTRVIVPTQYGGISVDIAKLREGTRGKAILIVENAAHALLATANGRPLGSLGDLGVLSFHATKNLTSGEGGALIINDASLFGHADIIRQKGTNRSQFLRGEATEYTWVDLGSSYLPSEVTAALLYSQLEAAERITAERRSVWRAYDLRCKDLEAKWGFLRPKLPEGCEPNGHVYYLIAPTAEIREHVQASLRAVGIATCIHYSPLHTSPAGMKHGRAFGDLAVTQEITERMFRLPLWPGMTHEVDQVVRAIEELL